MWQQPMPSQYNRAIGSTLLVAVAITFVSLALSPMADAFSPLHYSSPHTTTSPSTRTTTTPLFAGRNYGRRNVAPVKENRPPMNEEITAPQLRVTTPNPQGKDDILGIMSRDDAMAKAKELGNLDLILVNNNSDPPVCKIVNYSKYRYNQLKKQKDVKKHAKTSELKEVKMSYKIDVHDYAVRKKAALKFLKQGNRVKCTVMFRGREVQHDNLGFDLLDKLSGELDETCTTEGRPKREGRNLSLFLNPRPEVLKALSDERRALEKRKKQDKKDAFAKLEEEGGAGEAQIAPAAPATRKQQAAPKPRAEKTLEEMLGNDEFL